MYICKKNNAEHYFDINAIILTLSPWIFEYYSIIKKVKGGFSFMRKFKGVLSFALAFCVAASGMSVPVYAAPADSTGEALNTIGEGGEPSIYDGYELKWQDDFDGTELNRDNWNVELHEKGWVNNELQEYVDSEENIYVQDGKLYLNPVKKVTEAEVANLVPKDNEIEKTVSVSADKLNGNPWDVQLQQMIEGLEKDKIYMLSFEASSTEDRVFEMGVQQFGAPYGTFGSNIMAEVTREPKTFTKIFTMGDAAGVDVGVFANLGKPTDIETPASDVTISKVKLHEVSTVELVNPDNLVVDEEIPESKLQGNAWDVQKLSNLSLEQGHTYRVCYKASSTVERGIVAGVQQTTEPWGQYKQDFPTLKEELQDYTFEFTMDDTSDPEAGLYFNLGKMENGETPSSTVNISDVVVYDITEQAGYSASYTSGRISTQNKETWTYGLFEVKAKVPVGQGFLPAFWLMANDENIYGQWPRCGEIDCMEVMGQEPEKLYGTIHYGNPHSESQGTYTLTSGSFATEQHVFATEWLPGEIRWYVDGQLYHSEKDWYSTTEGQGTLTYPAPFDQPFYMILNLAVGGNWVGNPDESTSFDNNPFVIDYVKVYQKDSYDENVKRPEKVFVERDPDENGNYVVNGDYSEAEDLTDDNDWKFLNALEGVATAEIKDNVLTIKTENEGTVDYSIQLVQPNIPLLKGATYQVSFDAWASANRVMNVDIKAPDRGYCKYMDTRIPELTTVKNNYTYEFVMKSDSDANARLEFNMGAAGSTADINISNVVIKKLADPDPNAKEEKTVLANGNYIYNGSFQEGTAHLGFWDISDESQVMVSPFSDGRRLVTKDKTVTISQTELAFRDGTKYFFSFNAKSEKATKITATIGGNEYTFDIITDGELHDYGIEIPADAKFADNNVSLKLEGELSLDDVKLCESALIKNGSFKDGLTGFSVYVDSSAKASYVVDSLQNDSSLSVTVNDTGDADWKVQVKQENVKLENGKMYVLKFDAKSNLDRNIRVIIQGGEAKGWPVYSSDNLVDVTKEWQTYTDTFVMDAETDPNAFLSICLGKTGDEPITTLHTVVIDNISLEEHEHDFSMYVANGDGTHKLICNDCGKVSNAKIDCSGGTATCEKKAVCKFCKKEYGNLKAHVEKQTVKEATTTSEGRITYTCANCGKKLKEDKILEKLQDTANNSDVKLKKPSVKLANTTKGIKISWKKDLNATGYYVYRRTSDEKAYKRIKTITKNSVVSYVDSSKKVNGKRYYYRVAAYNNTNSKVIKRTSNSKGYCCLNKPSIKTLKNTKGRKLTVKWSSNKRASGYVIQYSASNKFKTARTITVKKASDVSKKISRLTKGKKYYVRVRAYKVIGKTKYYSAYSAVKKVTITK